MLRLLMVKELMKVSSLVEHGWSADVVDSALPVENASSFGAGFTAGSTAAAAGIDTVGQPEEDGIIENYENVFFFVFKQVWFSDIIPVY